MGSANLHLANRIGEVARLLEELAAFCSAQHVPEETTAALRLALEEVVTNVIHHGTSPTDAHTIDVLFQWEHDEFTAVVEDYGRPFDPLAHPVPDTEQAIEDRPIGGLGVYMVRRLMDGLEYRRLGNRNILTLKKR